LLQQLSDRIFQLRYKKAWFGKAVPQVETFALQ